MPFTPLYIERGAMADVEVPMIGPAGSLLMYRSDILHRGSNFEANGRARFSVLVDFQARGTTWGGKMAWPKDSPERWATFIPQCTVRQRDLFGFPRPGHDYWNEQTLTDVALRYPGIDMEPYRLTESLADRSVAHHLDSACRTGRGELRGYGNGIAVNATFAHRGQGGWYDGHRDRHGVKGLFQRSGAL